MGDGRRSVAVFTPAAASHVAGDVNGGAQEFASMLPPGGGELLITTATLMIAGGTAEVTDWQLHLFSKTPPSAIADDGAFALAAGDRESYLGWIDLGAAEDLGDTQWIEVHTINKLVSMSGTSLFGYLVNDTTLTPANVAHTVTLRGIEA